MPEPASSPPPTPRVAGLDALRGLAILTMVLSGVVPYRVLPAWMYHAQLPPPAHTFNPALPGLTWVDLVFPLFLFALGAALPLALGGRLRRGATVREVAGGVLQRGALLAAFAILLQHVRPFTLDPAPTARVWGVALAGFALLFAMYVRLPAAWPRARRWGVRAVGWGGMAALVAVLRYPDGSGFALGRSDIILLVLANVAVAGGWIWLATRHAPGVRWAVVAAVAAARVAGTVGGSWVADVWAWAPVGWLVQVDFLKYLLLVLPGTLAGEALAAARADRPDRAPWARWRPAALAVLGAALTVGLLVGLQARWLVPTTLGAAGAAALALWLVRAPATADEQRLAEITRQGVLWLALGLLLEPFQGGIKKDSATMSYLFLTAGVSCALLASFVVWTGRALERRAAGAPLRLLVANGQNPMLAYVGMANLLLPVLGLTHLDGVLAGLTPTPWLGALRGLAYTLALAGIVLAATRRGWVWRT